MSHVALVVVFQLEPGSREAMLPPLLAHRERCLSGEPGTLRFDVLVPSEEASTLILHELYQDSQSLAAHNQGSSLAQFRQEAGALIQSITRWQCTPAQEHCEPPRL